MCTAWGRTGTRLAPLTPQVGLPQEHDPFYTGPVCWSYFTLSPVKKPWDKCCALLDKFTREQRDGLHASLPCVMMVFVMGSHLLPRPSSDSILQK